MFFMRGRDCIWQPTSATGKCRIPLFWRASFDEDQVLLETVRGMLVVRGQGLHVERLQLEAGELIVEGEVGCLEYDDSVQPRGGFFSRLFGG